MASKSANTDDFDLTEAAAVVVADLMGAGIRTSERVRKGLMTFKYRVQTEGGEDIMVRFYPSGRSSVVNQEPDLLLRCRKAGLPVPETIGDSRTGPPAPFSYVAYFRIKGETLADCLPNFDKLQRQQLAADLASHLYRLQEVTFKGAGDLVSGIAGSAGSWSAFVRDSMRLGLDSVQKHSLLDSSLASALERAVLSGPPRSALATGRLVWGDINFENILVTERATVAGLIDFEGCLSGDPIATLGYCQAVHGQDSFFEMILRAWPEYEPAHDAWVAWYSLLRALRLARYAHLALPTGHPRDPLICIVPGIISAIATLNSKTKRPIRRKKCV